MRPIGYILWLGLLLFWGETRADEPAPPGAALRLMTWNIRFATPLDGVNAWTNRKELVAETIKTAEIDVFGMQEALKSQIDDLAKLLPDYAPYGVGRDDGREEGEHAPIFYHKERFELADKGTFWLSTTPDVPGSMSWDAAVTRVCGWVKLKDKTSSKTWLVLNAHLDHRGETSRRESAKLLLAKSRALAGELPVVLLGDFNTLADSATHQAITKGDPAAKGEWKLADARRVSAKPHEGPDSTWNGFKAIAPGQQIDFVFVGPKIKVLAHRILDPRKEGRFASDHLPIVAEVMAEK